MRSSSSRKSISYPEPEDIIENKNINKLSNQVRDLAQYLWNRI